MHRDTPSPRTRGRATARADRDIDRTLGRPEITDERLGLTPDADDTPEQEANRRRLEAVAAADFEPGGQYTGVPTTDANAGGSRVEVIAEEPDLTTSPHLLGDQPAGPGAADPATELRTDLDPSLTDQQLLTDPVAAVGGGDDWDDPVADGDEAYTPPMDPVVTTDARGEARVLGGFSADAMTGTGPVRSALDGRPGDEAIADAVRAALLRDASTTDLAIEVAVERGIVRLRGAVAGLEDADNAEAVASRVPGVVDVAEELRIANL